MERSRRKAMMTGTTTASGSAAKWGPLWGARPRDWGEHEELQRPTYEEAISRVPIRAGDRVLDIGCGTGVFLRLAADAGAAPVGLDASTELLEVAKQRVPEADLHQGDMAALPFEDGAFDLVTGFNSFFFAADMPAAIREAARVAKPDAPVVLQVWGPPERNALEPMKEVVRRYAPPPPPDAPKPPPLWQEGILEGIASQAGLRPRDSFDLAYDFEYSDEETLGRLLMAPMGLAKLVGPEREQAVRTEIVEVLAPNRRDDGSYALRNEFHFLIATA
jgi:SAM-dependent methyltransferase